LSLPDLPRSAHTARTELPHPTTPAKNARSIAHIENTVRLVEVHTAVADLSECSNERHFVTLEPFSWQRSKKDVRALARRRFHTTIAFR
jgi:hypothetical protein